MSRGVPTPKSLLFFSTELGAPYRRRKDLESRRTSYRATNAEGELDSGPGLPEAYEFLVAPKKPGGKLTTSESQ